MGPGKIRKVLRTACFIVEETGETTYANKELFPCWPPLVGDVVSLTRKLNPRRGTSVEYVAVTVEYKKGQKI